MINVKQNTKIIIITIHKCNTGKLYDNVLRRIYVIQMLESCNCFILYVENKYKAKKSCQPHDLIWIRNLCVFRNQCAKFNLKSVMAALSEGKHCEETYTHLAKQFNVVKLPVRTGFTWDYSLCHSLSLCESQQWDIYRQSD